MKKGGRCETAESPPSGPDVACCLLAGDTAALQELCNFPAAFSQVDDSGWYPLHRAVVQPLVLVLKMVLYGG